MTIRTAVNDIDLKFRTKRLFWRMGAYARVEVDLAGVSFKDSFKRVQFTDVDVLGVRIDKDLTVDYYIADCKAGKNVSAVERIYWLRGVMAFFGATQGYLLKTAVAQNAKELGAQLGIRAVSEPELGAMETSMGINNLKARSFDPDLYLSVQKRIQNLPSDLQDIYTYMRYRYWMERSHTNIVTLIAMLNRVGDKLEPGAIEHKLLFYEALALFSLAILHATGATFTESGGDLMSAVSVYLAGGARGYEHRAKLLNRISGLVGRNILDEGVRLDASYLPELCDVIGMLRNKASEASEIPRYIDAFLYEVVLDRQRGNFTAVVPKPDPITIKLARDVGTFLVSQSGVDEGILAELLSYGA